jgi:hypothetical protein
MSIITTASLIKINRPNGQELFNSNSKFIYYKRSASGTLTINNSSTTYVAYNSPGTHEFTLKFATVTSCDGNAVAPLLNLKLPLDSGMLLHIEAWNKDNKIQAYSIALVTGEAGNYVQLQQKSTLPDETTYKSLTFNYHFITYAYL